MKKSPDYSGDFFGFMVNSDNADYNQKTAFELPIGAKIVYDTPVGKDKSVSIVEIVK